MSELSHKTVFITGATGFLGGALARRLAAEGVHVRALARSPHKADYLRADSRIEIVPGDVTDPARMGELCAGCDVVFHVAAAFNDRTTQEAVNIEGARHVAQGAAAAGVGRLVHVSSIAVHGYRRLGTIHEDDPLRPAPNDAYSETKAIAELIVRDTGASTGLEWSIVRPAMIYGPRSGMWTINLFRAVQRDPIIFLGDGLGSAHPIHVDDVVDLLIVCATHPQAAGQVFHCAPDPAPTWREWLTAYARLGGLQPGWLAIPPTFGRGLARVISTLAPSGNRLRDLPDYVHSITRRSTFRMDKARDLLGWSPRVDLQTGVESCVPWLRDRGLLD